MSRYAGFEGPEFLKNDGCLSSKFVGECERQANIQECNVQSNQCDQIWQFFALWATF